MIETRTARRLLVATAFASMSFAGLAGIAAADTPPFQGGGVIVAPGPQPDPEPQPEPTPEPLPEGPGDIAQPMPEPDPDPAPGPEIPDDLAPRPADEDPELPPGPGDLTQDPCNVITHGCGEDGAPDDLTSDPGGDDEDTPDGHCFDDAGNVVDVADCLPDDKGSSDGTADGEQPKHDSRLPHTGAAGIALLTTLGTALVAGGTAAKRLAHR